MSRGEAPLCLDQHRMLAVGSHFAWRLAFDPENIPLQGMRRTLARCGRCGGLPDPDNDDIGLMYAGIGLRAPIGLTLNGVMIIAPLGRDQGSKGAECALRRARRPLLLSFGQDHGYTRQQREPG